MLLAAADRARAPAREVRPQGADRRRSVRPGEALAGTRALAAGQRGAADRQDARHRRLRALGPRGAGAATAGPQADRRLPRQGAGLWQHHVRRRAAGRAGDARGLRAVREKLVARGYKGDQAAHLDAAGRLGARRRRCDVEGLRGGARGGGPGYRPDARRLPLVQPHRCARARQGAGEARLRLDRGADGRAEHVDVVHLACRATRHSRCSGPRSPAGNDSVRAEWITSRRLRHPAAGVHDSAASPRASRSTHLAE